MSRVANKNTKPELAVRQQLHAAGFRFRLHTASLPGCPDIVLPAYRTVVFVHGCFWHGHACARGKKPGTNVQFWAEKIAGNIARDVASVLALQAEGWQVEIIWTCDLRNATLGSQRPNVGIHPNTTLRAEILPRRQILSDSISQPPGCHRQFLLRCRWRSANPSTKVALRQSSRGSMIVPLPPHEYRFGPLWQDLIQQSQIPE